jgi:hypothetical protein
VKFRRAVEETPSIRDAYRDGLQALRASDRAHVSAAEPRCLNGSIDLDSALRNAFPSAPRWDYGIAYQNNRRQSELVFWVEIHPARTVNHRNEITKKLDWLKNWLTTDGSHLGALKSRYVWVASGESAFTATSPQLRILAQSGLRFSQGCSTLYIEAVKQ